jgi:hypothetical protein
MRKGPGISLSCTQRTSSEKGSGPCASLSIARASRAAYALVPETRAATSQRNAPREAATIPGRPVPDSRRKRFPTGLAASDGEVIRRRRESAPALTIRASGSRRSANRGGHLLLHQVSRCGRDGENDRKELQNPGDAKEMEIEDESLVDEIGSNGTDAKEKEAPAQHRQPEPAIGRQECCGNTAIRDRDEPPELEGAYRLNKKVPWKVGAHKSDVTERFETPSASDCR